MRDTGPVQPLPDPWPAPPATTPVDAVITVPGSKSVTNRALVLAALADAPSLIRRPLRARDTELMAAALTALGAEVTAAGEDWQVTPATLRGPATVDVGLAGTVLRFVPPVAALVIGRVDFDGDPRARERPVGPLLSALRALGAAVDDDGRGALPFTLHGAGGLPGGTAVIDASSSSQLVSGLLLAAPRFEEGLLLRHVGPPVPSSLQLAMTAQMLRDAGVPVDDMSTPDGREWTVKPGPLAGREILVAPDLSTAAPFAAAALATGGRVHLPGWPGRSFQPGDLLPGLLIRMGAQCTVDGTGLTVTAGAAILGLDADLADGTELVPVLAALAALADGPSTFRGIGHMRGHETDRLAALARELTSLGGAVTETADGLRIEPRPLHGGVFHTYHDHRLAMAAAVLGLAVPGIQVENMATTGKTDPAFTDRWLAMLGPGAAGPGR
ncbi:MAG TPA: 3-phosphoshikimate 1-carboxyvinyltransferase [Mycobacteriales bacterium]|nr:3-phosphoshikimate 1-carboxyvinyltransferase [Mycobacteriales bacterium]